MIQNRFFYGVVLKVFMMSLLNSLVDQDNETMILREMQGKNILSHINIPYLINSESSV